ncbi:MAG: homocysteine S-methyltransferase family protein [Candidatus Heimdallarchaeota archaeon]|nr:homocysteine S-methyltransferase family protein [Candidatus Heimdallarchaeota archaeon]MDH5644884.1 homocysteine S-methyltransferase family protein [Candidatus Heimdallarchaeota archaeon]
MILLDGPMGSEIHRLGGDTSLPLWSAKALVEQPHLIKQIHLEYLEAGADVITTNTFRTQDTTLRKAGYFNSKEIVELAVMLAKEAKFEVNPKAKVAGSIAPIEDCYLPDLVPSDEILKQEHNITTKNLIDANVDLFLIETMNSMREAKFAYTAASEYDIPIWLGFTCDSFGQILGKDSWDDVINYFQDKVDVLMVNCTSLQGSKKVVEIFSNKNVNNWGVYPNFGKQDPIKGWTAAVIPETFNEVLNYWIELKPKVLGTCCGATPEETKLIRKIIDTKMN